MNKLAYVYGLVDPRDGQVRYVGQSDNPQRRYKEHFRHSFDTAVISFGESSEKTHWLYDVWLWCGVKPELSILEECSAKEVNKREVQWINRMARNGRYLSNKVCLRNNYQKGLLQELYAPIWPVITNRPYWDMQETQEFIRKQLRAWYGIGGRSVRHLQP